MFVLANGLELVVVNLSPRRCLLACGVLANLLRFAEIRASDTNKQTAQAQRRRRATMARHSRRLLNNDGDALDDDADDDDVVYDDDDDDDKRPRGSCWNQTKAKLIARVPTG